MINNSSEKLEQPNSKEILDEETFYDFTNFVANHEAKLTVATILASYPDEGFDGLGLKRELEQRQKPFEGWIPDEQTLKSYFKSSFTPAGLTEICDIGELEEKIGYKFINGRENTLLSLAGRLIPWSLEYPSYSTQQLLGRTQPKNVNNPSRARYQIYEQMLSNTDGFEIEELINILENKLVDSSHIQKQISELSKIGILEIIKTRANQKAHRKLTISEEYISPLTDLYLELEDFKRDPNSNKYIEVALKEIDNPETISSLLDKARTFSSSVVASEQGHVKLREQLFSIISSIGSLTVGQAREELMKDGRRLGEDATRNVLQELERRDCVISDLQVDPKNQRLNKVYKVKLN